MYRLELKHKNKKVLIRYLYLLLIKMNLMLVVSYLKSIMIEKTFYLYFYIKSKIYLFKKK